MNVQEVNVLIFNNQKKILNWGEFLIALIDF